VRDLIGHIIIHERSYVDANGQRRHG
jgi:hypothetical protein